MTEPTVLAIPFFIGSMAIEAWVLSRRQHGYELKDWAASLSGGLGSLVVNGALKGALFAWYTFLSRYAVWNPGAGVLGWVLLVLCEDLCYYAYHRASHEVRFLWSSHVVHHSSERYTLGTALRQSWTAGFVHFAFWSPLPLLGFAPENIMLMSSFSLLYQYWIHTETIGKLGPIEWIFNTPSHHRVHHGSNPQYLDRNHAGILIVWDRLFGTFEPEGEKVVYGLTKPVKSYNPVWIQVHEMFAIGRDVLRARSVGDAWRALVSMKGSGGAMEDAGVSAGMTPRADRAA